jgi:Txe/YoeB family toxin of Txe-Axe toxin-antitoxin module
MDDLLSCAHTNQKPALRVLDWVKVVLRDPVAGIVMPERLKYFGGNVWRRRINESDRLAHEVFNDRIA